MMTSSCTDVEVYVSVTASVSEESGRPGAPIRPLPSLTLGMTRVSKPLAPLRTPCTVTDSCGRTSSSALAAKPRRHHESLGIAIHGRQTLRVEIIEMHHAIPAQSRNDVLRLPSGLSDDHERSVVVAQSIECIE